MNARSLKRINEANEAFGSPAPNPKLNDLGLLMVSLGNSLTPEAGLRVALDMAEAFEADAYSAVLDPALKIMAAGVEFELLREFFHKAATFGQGRQVSNIVSEVHLAHLLKSSGA